MAQPRIDPRSPGKSTDTDAFKDPYGRIGAGLGNNGHENLGRDGGGRFSGFMPRGGESPQGDECVEKWRPRGSAPTSSIVPRGANLNDEGTGYDDSDEGVDQGYTVNKNVVKQP